MADESRYELSHIDKIAMPIVVNAFVIYKLSITDDRKDVIDSITAGLSNATMQCPFMAGKIHADESGKPVIVSLPEDRVQCIIREYTPSEHPSFNALQNACFPSTEFKPDFLLPSFSATDKPICALQLNFIEDGLILGFAMDHKVGDWASMKAFLSLVCQGSKAHRRQLSMPTYIPDLDRSPYNGQPDSGIPRSELLKGCPGFYATVNENAFLPSRPPPQFSSGIYSIRDSAVQRLKEECTEMLDGVDYVTSYDCIAALLWVSITRARTKLNPSKIGAQSRFLHPIDLRSRDPEKLTSAQYFGNAVFPSQAGPVNTEVLLGAQGLGTAASSIRKSINFVSMATINNLTNLVAGLAPAEKLGFDANFFDMDILLNSWYTGKATDFDIGVESLPQAFRTQRRITGATCLILPTFESTDTRTYDIWVQLATDEHEALRQAGEFLESFKIKV